MGSQKGQRGWGGRLTQLFQKGAPGEVKDWLPRNVAQGSLGPAASWEVQVLFSSWVGRPRCLSAELISPDPLGPSYHVCGPLRGANQCPGPAGSLLPAPDIFPCLLSPPHTRTLFFCPPTHTHAPTPQPTRQAHPYVMSMAVVC